MGPGKLAAVAALIGAVVVFEAGCGGGGGGGTSGSVGGGGNTGGQPSFSITSTPSALYWIGTPTTFSTYFRDITQGSNTRYSAKSGYDEVTGLGSPEGGTLIPALATALAQAASAAVPAVTPSAVPQAPPAGWRVHPMSQVVAAASRPVGYSPTQLRHAYGFDQTSKTGAGQTIAIVIPYGSSTIQQDLDTFCAAYNLPTTTVSIAYPAGHPSSSDANWASEAALDVEWAHAMAPGASILMCVAVSDSFSDLVPAIDYAAAHASQVSMSWGGAEWQGETTYDSHFAVSGVSFVSASGDTGGAPIWPAASAYVVGVGATTLNLNGAGSILSETAWSGSNGGPSTVFSEPTYQSQWQTSGMRETPDVCCVGNPNTGVSEYDSTPDQGQVGWYEVGGTSLGTVIWAALFAVARS